MAACRSTDVTLSCTTPTNAVCWTQLRWGGTVFPPDVYPANLLDWITGTCFNDLFKSADSPLPVRFLADLDVAHRVALSLKWRSPLKRDVGALQLWWRCPVFNMIDEELGVTWCSKGLSWLTDAITHRLNATTPPQETIPGGFQRKHFFLGHAVNDVCYIPHAAADTAARKQTTSVT